MTLATDPLNLDGRKQAVRERDRHRCMNCTASGSDVTLDVHHIVPRGQAGSNRLSNMVVLCRRCHDAAHRKGLAPHVKFDNGAMDNEAFGLYVEYWRTLDIAIFDEATNCWCVPKADMERLIEIIRGEGEAGPLVAS